MSPEYDSQDDGNDFVRVLLLCALGWLGYVILSQ